METVTPGPDLAGAWLQDLSCPFFSPCVVDLDGGDETPSGRLVDPLDRVCSL